MVQDVEEFRTELEIVTFAERCALQQREIQSVVLRANQCVPACRSINTRRGTAEYARIEIEGRRADRCARGNGAATNARSAARVTALPRDQVRSVRRAASKSADS